MKKLLAISLIIAATCSISFPLDASGLFMGGIFSGGINIPTFLNPFSKDGKTIEKHFKVSQGKRLEMNLSIGGGIKISGWDKDELYVKVIKAGKDDDKCRIDFEENSEGIRISSEYEGEEKNTICTDMTYEIKVPNRFNINLTTMGGEISADGVEGKITGETKGGLVSLNNIKGDLNLRTMGGNIDLRNSDVDGSVTTMGGSVVIDNVKGDVKGTSMGGNVTYTNVTRRNNKEMSKEVNITSMGGDIEISEADGSVNATTMSGDVNVKVLGNANSSDHDVKLTSMSGDVTLYVPSDFSMDVNIKIALPDNGSKDRKVISDFDLNIQEKEPGNKWHSSRHGSNWKRLEAKGSFNGGRNHIDITAMNGNVYLKKI